MRMEDQVTTCRKVLNVTSQRLAQPSFDAIALVGLSEDLSDSEPYSWAACRGGLRSQKPTHRRRSVFPPIRIGELIVGVLAQA